MVAHPSEPHRREWARTRRVVARPNRIQHEQRFEASFWQLSLGRVGAPRRPAKATGLIDREAGEVERASQGSLGARGSRALRTQAPVRKKMASFIGATAPASLGAAANASEAARQRGASVRAGSQRPPSLPYGK